MLPRYGSSSSRQAETVSKYNALTSALAERPEAEVVLTFDEIDQVVAGGLPRSARTYSEWWANRESSQPHSAAWLRAGRLAAPDFDAGTATFALDRDEALSRLGAYVPKTERSTPVNAFWVTVGGHAPENLDLGLEGSLGYFRGYEDRVGRVVPGDLVVFYERNRGTGSRSGKRAERFKTRPHLGRTTSIESGPVSHVLAEAPVRFGDIYDCLRDQSGAGFDWSMQHPASIQGGTASSVP